jgi:hypothetical protein
MKCHALPALALAMIAAPVAHAQPKSETFNATISFDRDSAAEAAYADVQRQARRACETSGRRTLDVIAADRACAIALIDQVIGKTSRTDLALLHFDRTGREVATPFDMAAANR